MAKYMLAVRPGQQRKHWKRSSIWQKFKCVEVDVEKTRKDRIQNDTIQEMANVMFRRDDCSSMDM